MEGLFSDTDGDLWLGPYWYLMEEISVGWQDHFLIDYSVSEPDAFFPLTLLIPKEYLK